MIYKIRDTEKFCVPYFIVILKNIFAYILTRIKKVGANMQINKGNINLKEQIAGAATSVLVEGDVILSDGNPDVAEILCADAKVKVTDTEYRNGRLIVSGYVDFTALYMPDGADCELKKMSRQLDFSTAVEMKGNENASFKTEATTEHIGFTLVNSRKLTAKVMVSVKAWATEERIYEPIVEINGDEAEFIEKKYSIYMPMSDALGYIEINDLLTVPEDMPDIAEILKVDGWVTSADVRVMTDKVMVQGDLHLNTIYTAATEKRNAVCVSHTIPFTEIVEAPGADEQSVVKADFDVCDILASIKGDLNGDTKIISVEATLRACVKVSKTAAQTIIDDCYFLSGKTELKEDKMRICEYVTSENTRLTERQTAEMPKNVQPKEIVSCVARPILKNAYWENGTAQVSGVLVSYLIYRDEQDNIRCAVVESELNWKKALSEECVIDACMSLESVDAVIEGKEAKILANIGLFVKALKCREVNILTDCEQKMEEINGTKPSMVVYFAKDGDTVWNVAKKYCTKAEKIRLANGLEKETIEKGRRLLIPMA